jgi:hypothetical protein
VEKVSTEEKNDICDQDTECVESLSGEDESVEGQSKQV